MKSTSNTSNDRDSQNSTLTDQKFVISFSNDQYRKRARSPSPSPIIKRLNNASIQTATTSSSRLSNRRDSDELPKKQQGLLTTTSRVLSLVFFYDHICFFSLFHLVEIKFLN